MDVSRTVSENSVCPAPRRNPWPRWVSAAVLSTSLAAGCQSTTLFSRSKKSEESAQQAIERALAANRPPESKVRTASHSSVPPVGAAGIDRHLREGEALLAQNSHDPAQLGPARAHFEEVLRIDPNHTTAHHRLAVIADLQQDFATAERHYAQAMRGNPRDPQLLHDIGYSYILQGRASEAIPYLQQSLLQSPGFEMAARKLADAYIQTRQPELARQTLEQILPKEQAAAELARLQHSRDPAARPSLFGRVRQNLEELRPEKRPELDPTQELLADLEKARIDGERARREREQAQSRSSTSPWNGNNAPGTPRALHDSQLSQALASIDQAGRPHSGAPVVLGHDAGHDPRLAAHQYSSPQGHGYAPPNSSPAANAHGWTGPEQTPQPTLYQTAQQSPHQVGYGAPQGSAAMTGGQVPVPGMNPDPSFALQPANAVPEAERPAYGYQSSGGVIVAAGDARSQARQTSASPDSTFAPAEMIRGWQRGTTLSASPSAGHASAGPLTAGTGYPGPHASAIQPAGGRWTPGRLGDTTPPGGEGDPAVSGRNGSQAVTNADFRGPVGSPAWATPSLGRQTAIPSGPIGPSQTIGGPNGSATTAWGNNAGPSPQAAQPTDDYRTAAAMGMGIAPGQMFPVLQQAERSSAGSHSLWNGSLYPEASRDLPSNRPPADLSRAYVDLSQAARVPTSGEVVGNPIVPPPNSHGQQMPAGGQYYNQATQISSGGVWNGRSAAPGQPPAMPVNPLQSYEQLRSQYDASSNAAIQQTHGQYPTGQMFTPSYGLPRNGPEAPGAQMNTWNTTWDAQQNAAAAVGMADPTARNPGQAHGRPTVIPEQYPSSPQGTYPSPGNFHTPASGGSAHGAPQVTPLQGYSQLPPANYAPSVVVPAPYRGGQPGQISGSASPQGIQRSGYQTSGNPNYSGPLIIPGQ